MTDNSRTRSRAVGRIVALLILLVVTTGVLAYCGWRYYRILTSPYQRVEIVIRGPFGAAERRATVQQSIAVLKERLKHIGVDYYDVRSGREADIDVLIPASKHPNRMSSLVAARAKLEMRPVASESDTVPFVTLDGRQLRLYPPDVMRLSFSGGNPTSLHVRGTPVITGADVQRASVTQNELGRPVVSVHLTPDGAKRFEQWTGSHIGSRLAVVFNDKIIVAPEISGRIPDGSVEIQGEMTAEQAYEIAMTLDAGYLPHDLVVMREVLVPHGFPAPKRLLYAAIVAGIACIMSAVGLAMVIRLGRRG